MKSKTHSLFLLAVISLIALPTVRAEPIGDPRNVSAPLMMLETEGKEERQDQQQVVRERRSAGDTSDSASPLVRGDLARQGMYEADQNYFDGASFSPSVRERSMISSVNVGSSISLEAIQKVIDADPKAVRLIIDGNKKNPSLVASNPWYGSMIRVVLGNSADQQARQILRESVGQKYNLEVANRVCPPIYDGEVLSASQADRILKMAPVIQEKQNEYPLFNMRDENMGLVTYARDTALVAQAAVTELIIIKATLLEQFKQQGIGNAKIDKALTNHPDFIAAREEAHQATLYASEAAESAVAALQKITTRDSSFGARAALAEAQFHAAASRKIVVTTGQEKNLDIKTAEAIESATEAHDAYKMYRDVSTKASSVERAGIETVANRKEQLQQVLSDLLAAKDYATKIDKSINNLCSVMITFDPFNAVPIEHSSMKVKVMIEYAVAKEQQLQGVLASEEQLPLERNNSNFYQNQLYQEAAVQRILTSTQRIKGALENSVESALKITAIKGDTFLNFSPTTAIRDSYLTAVEKAAQEYQEKLRSY